MLKAASKHYSLLFQDDFNEDILSLHNDKISEEEEEDIDDGFNSMIGDEVGLYHNEHEDIIDDIYDIDEIEDSDEEIFNEHRPLANEGIRLTAGRKNDYRLLTNGNVDTKQSFEAPLSTVWMPTPMSPVRRAFFLASIMFGILVVALFIWALPCDVQPCEKKAEIRPRQWFTEMDYVGINYTKILTKTNGGTNVNIILSYYKIEKFSNNRTDMIDSENPHVDLFPQACGLFQLNSNNGKEGWRQDLEECPSIIDCELIDSTGDGVLDCLILGHISMALMVEPIYGSILWHIHTNPNANISIEKLRFDRPIILEDLDSDNIEELLFPASENEKNSFLLLISGKTGSVLGKPFSIANCNRILKVYDEGMSIGYSCSMENRNELTGKIPLTTLLNGIDIDRNKTKDAKFSKIPSVTQSTGVCQIKFSNNGNCPLCNTRIEMGTALENPLYKQFEYSSVVSWKTFSFENTCKGAILKLWKWDSSSLLNGFSENSDAEVIDDDHLYSEQQSPGNSLRSMTGIRSISEKNEKISSIYGEKKAENKFRDSAIFRDKTRENKLVSPDDDTFYEDKTQKNIDIDDEFYSIVGGDVRLNSTMNPSLSAFDGADGAGTLPPSSISPPSGYRLRSLEEVLVLVTFNGSDWLSRELGSMIVYQLCSHEDCFPSHLSQKDTVLLNVSNGFGDGREWNVYASSSTFTSFHEGSVTMWSIESYVRKLIVDLTLDRDLL